MPSKLSASDSFEMLMNFSENSKMPLLEIDYATDGEFKVLHLHVVETEVLLKDFLSFCKLSLVEYITFTKNILDKVALDDIVEDGVSEEDDDELESEEGDEEEEDQEDIEEEGLTPRAEEIILDSIKRQALELSKFKDKMGLLTIWAYKGNAVFKFEALEDWYELYLKLNQVRGNIEKYGPDILNEDERKIYEKEMGDIEPAEAREARKDDELENMKSQFVETLSKDKAFLNGKNRSLRLIRVEKLFPKNLQYRFPTSIAMDMAISLFVETVEKLREEGKSDEEISKQYGVDEKILKKYS
jgi:hypothetical protein